MGSTASGLPYPEPTAPVREGAQAIRALAEALDPRAPKRTWSGRGGYSTNSQGGIAINLPFVAATVVATSEAGGYMWMRPGLATPATTVWLNYIDTRTGGIVANTFGIVNVAAWK